MPRLTQVQGFSPKQARRFGKAVLAAIARGVELGPMRKVPRNCRIATAPTTSVTRRSSCTSA
jgi:hypothetical protein